MLNRLVLNPIAAAVLVVLAGAGPVLAKPAIQEEVSVSPAQPVSPRDETAISSAAVKVLRHIADARGYLAGDEPDTGTAVAQLDQSERLLDIIETVLPSRKVKDHIWVEGKDLDYTDTREVQPDLVPIYASLEELVDYMPSARGKAQLDKATQAMKQGDQSPSTGKVKVVGDALLYVEADLPLGATRHLLAEAKTKLDQGDVQSADEALAAAQESVIVVSASIQSPLTQAKAALWRAREDYSRGEQDLAQVDLSDAVRYLERAARSQDELTREAAGTLVSQVRDINATLEAGDLDLSARLDNIWHRVEALSERSAEHISTGWQRMRAESPSKKDLIEAKLQLSYARIDHLYTRDDAAAKVDLAEAKGYLKAAAEEASPEAQAQIKQVSDLVSGLEQALSQDDTAQQQGSAKAFREAETRLSVLIRQS
jgi:hypothetical protein